MAKSSGEAALSAQRIFDNIIFLEQAFIGSANEEIPDVPFLELAKSFELKGGDRSPATGRKGKNTVTRQFPGHRSIVR